MQFASSPALLNAAAGRATTADLKTDALARSVYRADQPKDNFGDYHASATGGMPAQKGPEANLPYLLEAAQKLGIDPSRAHKALPWVRQVPNERGGMFGNSLTSDPREQARLGLMQLAAMGQL